MKKRVLAVALMLVLCLGLLPGAGERGEAADVVLSEEFIPAEAPVEEPSAPEVFTTASEEVEEDVEEDVEGPTFNPYVFTVDENAEVSAAVALQPELMGLEEAETEAVVENDPAAMMEVSNYTYTAAAPVLLRGSLNYNSTAFASFTTTDFTSGYYELYAYTTEDLNGTDMGMDTVGGVPYYTIGIMSFGTTPPYTSIANLTSESGAPYQGVVLEQELYYGQNDPPRSGSVLYFAVQTENSPISNLLRVVVDGGVSIANLTTTDPVPITSENLTISMSPNSFVYDGITSFSPHVTVYDAASGTYLEKGTHYYLLDGENRNAGKGTVTVIGAEPYYTGNTTLEFPILPAPISENMTVVLDPESCEYSGGPNQPDVTVYNSVTLLKLIPDRDFTVEYGKNVDAGQGSVTIKAVEPGNYTGNSTVYFPIDPVVLSENSTVVLLDKEEFEYTGAAVEPKETVTYMSGSENRALMPGTDYSVAYSENTNAGTGLVTVTGKGNYIGNSTVEFAIVPAGISNTTVTLTPAYFLFYEDDANRTYIPEVEVTYGGAVLKQGADYDVSFTDNTGLGTGHAAVTGKGNFRGDLIVDFPIREPMNCTVTFEANGGAGVMEPVVVKEGSVFTLPECGFEPPIMQKFSAWDRGAVGDTFTVTGDTTVTAQWEDNIYPILTVNNVSFTVENATSDLIIRIDADYSKFTGVVEIDGAVVPANMTESWEGSTFVLVKADYINTLKPGAHTLVAYFTDGKAIVDFTIQEPVKDTGKPASAPRTMSPKTADGSPVALWTVTLLACTAGAALTLSRRRRSGTGR